MNCGNSTNLLPRSRAGSSGIRLHSRLSTVGRASFFMHKNLKDMTGLRFGRLVVISYAGSVKVPNGTRAYWFCKCDCGNTHKANASSLRMGTTSSCGCFARESMSAKFSTHGHTIGGASLTYNSWRKMIERCFNSSTPNYYLYGGRGITVCEQWRDFRVFLADMGERPSKRHSLDRYPNNDGNYEPSNCRWATQKEQCRNKRDNHFLTHNGKTLCIVDWAAETGLKRKTIERRLNRGWSAEQTLDTPLLKSRHARTFNISKHDQS